MHTHTPCSTVLSHTELPKSSAQSVPQVTPQHWPRSPPPLQVHGYRTGSPILRLQPALPVTLSMGKAGAAFPPLKSIPHPCAHTCVLTPAKARKGTAWTGGTSQGVWGRSCSSLGQRWAWAVNPGSGNEGVRRHCPGAAAPFAGGGSWDKVASANPWRAALQPRAQNHSGQRELPAVTPWGEKLNASSQLGGPIWLRKRFFLHVRYAKMCFKETGAKTLFTISTSMFTEKRSNGELIGNRL